MAELTAAQRRRNVEKAQRVYRELGEFESVLLDAQARIPALIGRVRTARELLDEALSGRASGDEHSPDEPEG